VLHSDLIIVSYHKDDENNVVDSFRSVETSKIQFELEINPIQSFTSSSTRSSGSPRL
jgi:hypothetical protein